MTTKVQICNLALGRIGINQYIEDIDDPNDKARACKQFYDLCRQQALQDFPWNFARAVVALAELTTDPPPGWPFAYRYPTDCLQVRALCDEDGNGVRSAMIASVSSWDEWSGLIATRYPWQVQADPNEAGARLIATDLEDAYCWYTVDVTEPNQFSPLFVSALAWRLAAELAGPLRADARLRDAAEQQYVYIQSKAAAGSLNEEQVDRAPESPSILARL